MRYRRASSLGVCATILASMLFASPSRAQVAGDDRRCDFNGDGRDDLAIGAPAMEEVRGAVFVRYSGQNAFVTFRQGSQGLTGAPEAGDGFGTSLACLDFNADGFDDLAVGVSGEGIDGVRGAGIVQLLKGGRRGLVAHRAPDYFAQGRNGLAGQAEPDDEFGVVLAAGDFNGDSRDDLAVGTPYEDLGADLADAGVVQVLNGTQDGLRPDPDPAYWWQGHDGLGGRAEALDLFGTALAAGDFNRDGHDDLAVGTPMEVPGQLVWEESGASPRRGIVQILTGSPAGLTGSAEYYAQGRHGIPTIDEPRDDEDHVPWIDIWGDFFGATLAAGDFDGDGRDDLAIGAPGESTAMSRNVGVVHVLEGRADGMALEAPGYWMQGENGLGDQPEMDDAMGRLAAGDFNGDGRDDLAIGVFYEGLGRADAAGIVQVLAGTKTGLTAMDRDFWRQGARGLAGVLEAKDYFGWALASGDYDGDGREDLAIGVPGEDFADTEDAGQVFVLKGSVRYLTGAGSEIVLSPDRMEGATFGIVIAR